MSLLIFFIGLWIGALFGVFIMCLFQISGKCAENERSRLYLKSREEGSICARFIGFSSSLQEITAIPYT